MSTVFRAFFGKNETFSLFTRACIFCLQVHNTFSMRKRLSLLFNVAIPTSAFLGLISSFVYAKRDGYSHWLRRATYFTAQSNLWVGVVFLAILLSRLYHGEKRAKLNGFLYVAKYVVTVSITATGLIFCFVLGPFADDSYHPWSYSSLLTHVITPLLCIADFFIDDKRAQLSLRHCFLAVLPPFFYIVTASSLEISGFDFGRGVPYPYFFLNFRSPAGVFGFSNVFPFFIGSAYWILLFGALIFTIAYVYARAKKTN